MTPRSKEVSIKQKMERDPVCGMSVDPQKAAAKVEYAGKTYYFLTQLLSLYPAFPGLEFVQPDSDEAKYLIGTLPQAVWKEKK